MSMYTLMYWMSSLDTQVSYSYIIMQISLAQIVFKNVVERVTARTDWFDIVLVSLIE